MKLAVWLGHVVVVAVALGLPRTALARDVTRAPTPAWVTPLVTDDAELRPTEQGFDSFTLLADTRVRLEGSKYQQYDRRVRRASTAAGVERLAEILIGFDPEQEDLVLHHIHLRRAGQVIDQTKSARVRLVAEESDLERRMYNGEVTAFIVLDDVRTGDVVDAAFSLVGSDPILGGRYAARFELQGSDPVRRRHIAILPVGERPKLRPHLLGDQPGTARPVPGDTWVDLENLPPRLDEDRVPPLERSAWFEASEFDNWREVATWGAALYPKVEPSPIVVAQANALAGDGSAKEAALRALRFVQDEIRYLAISNEGHAVAPHPPEKVLAQRFGDCKDKVYLLLQLLRARGIDSWPMLVHSSEKEWVAKHITNPYAFNHVILLATIAGKDYFLDATHSQQGGSLASQVEPDFGYGLVLTPEASFLEGIPTTPLAGPEQRTESKIVVGADGSASIDVTTTLLGRQADSMRSDLVYTPLAKLSERYLNYYEKVFADVQVQTPLEVRDDRLANRLLLSECYRVPKFWRDGQRYLPTELGGYLELPSVVRRKAALFVDHPVWQEETVRLALPFSSSLQNDTDTSSDGFIKFVREVRNTGAEIVATFSYQSLAERVPADQVLAHVAALQRARDYNGLDLSDEDAEGAATGAQEHPTWQLLLAAFGMLMAMVALAFAIPITRSLKKAYRRRRFRSARLGSLGETPARPEAVATLSAAASILSRLRCSCGVTYGAAEPEWTPLRFEGATLHAARLRCGGCGDAQRRYFAIQQAEDSET